MTLVLSCDMCHFPQILPHCDMCWNLMAPVIYQALWLAVMACLEFQSCYTFLEVRVGTPKTSIGLGMHMSPWLYVPQLKQLALSPLFSRLLHLVITVFPKKWRRSQGLMAHLIYQLPLSRKLASFAQSMVWQVGRGQGAKEADSASFHSWASPQKAMWSV